MLTSLYIHIPFCDQICTYCDFHKQKATTETKHQYITALIKEVHHYKESYNDLETIYIGGGTPLSLHINELQRLLESITDVIDVHQLKEFTIEANPNNITKEKITLMREHGVNRISIGVQTFNPKHLDFLGRDHTKEDVFHSVRLLQEMHFPSISVDMIFSLVNQTIQEVEEDIQLALQLNVDHISYYSLILEEKTILHHLVSKNKITMNTDDVEETMYNKVIDTLVENGYHHYEISNFAKVNHESYHNKTYWMDKDYLGLGSGAHSLWNNRRFYHKRHVTEYINHMTNNHFDCHQEEDRDALAESLMMGMRLMDGVHIPTIESTYNISLFDCYPLLRTYVHRGFLRKYNDHLQFTRKGLMVGNMVFRLFLEGPSC